MQNLATGNQIKQKKSKFKIILLSVLGFFLFIIVALFISIQILSFMAVEALDEARIKSADAKTVAGVKMIESSLNEYWQENFKYPPSLNDLIIEDSNLEFISSDVSKFKYTRKNDSYYLCFTIDGENGANIYIQGENCISEK